MMLSPQLKTAVQRTSSTCPGASSNFLLTIHPTAHSKTFLISPHTNFFILKEPCCAPHSAPETQKPCVFHCACICASSWSASLPQVIFCLPSGMDNGQRRGRSHVYLFSACSLKVLHFRSVFPLLNTHMSAWLSDKTIVVRIVLDMHCILSIH